MKILLNALSAKLGGGQTYLVNFLHNIPADFPHEIIFLCGTFNEAKFRPEFGPAVRMLRKGAWSKNSLLRTLWEKLLLPRYLKKNHVDVYFQPAAGVPIRVPAGCRSVTMLRNMLPFEDRERQRFPLFSSVRIKMALQKRQIIKSLKRYDRVIFISSYSRDFIAKFIPNIHERSTVIPHGLNAQFLERDGKFDVGNFGLRPGEFYLYVSILDYYKAQLELVREWKCLSDRGFPYPLVLAGFLNRKDYVKKIRDEIKRLGLEKQIILTGAIPNGDLPGFYAQARALVFASSCECCPNILLEKMSSGKPLFCSDIPPMPEFGEDAPFYFSPYEPGDLSRKILDAESDPAEMLRRGERARELALTHTWKDSVKNALTYITEN